MKQINKRYIREFSISMVAYLITIILSVTLIENMPEDSAWRIPLALAPVVPIIFQLLAFIHYLTGVDELQQRIHLLAIGFAAGAVGLLSFSYGFLENVGFPPLP